MQTSWPASANSREFSAGTDLIKHFEADISELAIASRDGKAYGVGPEVLFATVLELLPHYIDQ